MKPSVIEFEIDWADCDPAGIVFYPQFFRMMNVGMHKMFEHVGLPFRDLIAKFGTSGVPMLDVHATFKSPARFGDKVRLESEITEWRNKTFLVRHVLKLGADGQDGRVIFEGNEVRAWAVPDPTAANGIRAVPIPAELKALFGD